MSHPSQFFLIFVGRVGHGWAISWMRPMICSVGSVVRAVRYITKRLPVLIQAVRFCPSGESARTLFKSSESNPTLSNKQNSPHSERPNPSCTQCV